MCAERINQKKVKLMELADNMASAATTFNAHGYSMFIQARDEFKEALSKLDEVLKEAPKTH